MDYKVNLFGSPCKLTSGETFIYGRYIGDSKITCKNDNVLVIATPMGSIRHVKESCVSFDMSFDDKTELTFFEADAIECGKWYHRDLPLEELNATDIISVEDIIPPIARPVRS